MADVKASLEDNKYRVFSDTTDGTEEKWAIELGLCRVSNRGVRACGKQWSVRFVSMVSAIGFLGILCLALFCILVRFQSSIITDICVNPGCLHSAAFIAQTLNESISPCDNFYRYACDNYQETEALTIYHYDRLPLRFGQRQLQSANVKHLIEILNDYAFDISSAKGKVRLYYQSCIDDMYRTLDETEAFLNVLLPEMGGWWLLGNFSSLNWDFNLAMRKSHVDLWVDSFATYELRSHPDKPNSRVLELKFGGLGRMDRSTYVTPYKVIQIKYRVHMAKLLTLLLRSHSPNISPTEAARTVNTTVDDAYMIEENLAKIFLNSTRSSRIQAITLGQLTAQSGEIDWLNLFRYFFEDSSVAFNSDTTIYTREMNYLIALDNYLKTLKRSVGEEIYKRILNNYIGWRVFDQHAWHLSYEYFMLQKSFHNFEHESIEIDCFREVDRVFRSALGSIYVENNLHEDTLNQMQEMLSLLKRSLQSVINGVSWMDDPTKSIALSKIDQLKSKIGFPDFIVDETKLNYIYRKFQPSHVYLENVMSAYKYFRDVWVRRVSTGYAPEDEWRKVAVYDPIVLLRVYLNEILVPAGSLQWPFYFPDLPPALNMAAIGSLIGSEMTDSIGEIGRFLRVDGKYRMWWSNNTVQNYIKRRTCVYQAVQNLTAEYYSRHHFFFSYFQRRMTRAVRRVLSEVAGVDVARQAYEYSLKNPGLWGTQHHLPGVNLNWKQIFYVAYAQTHCHSMHKLGELLYLTDSQVSAAPSEVLVNYVLAQVPDFSKTFSCRSGTSMSPVETCQKIY